MPSSVENLFGVTSKFSVRLSSVFGKSLVVKDPKFAGGIIRNGGKKRVIKRRERDIVYITLMTVYKRNRGIKNLVGISLETSKSSWSIPTNSCEFVVASNTITIIVSGRGNSLELLRELCTLKVLELL